MFRHDFDPTSLREYDIRGIVGRTLRDTDAYAIGRCFGTMVARAAGTTVARAAGTTVARAAGTTVARAAGTTVARAAGTTVARAGGTTVAIGQDGRLSSPSLAEALSRGLRDSGISVLDIGRGPTPMLYYAATALKTAPSSKIGGAIMVTGSHNPPDYNGFKMVFAGKPFFGDQIQAIGRMAREGDVVPEANAEARKVDIAAEYRDRLLAGWDGGDRALKVVWDNGNGAAGDVLAELVKGLPGHHTILNGTIDGRFPAHHPDPTVPKNLEQLIAEVHARGADIGIAFDGDADRIGLVDDTGTMMFGDQLLVLLARDVLKTHPGATIIADVKASQVLFDEIARAGGKPLMWKTGHSLIKSKMAEVGCPLAGEMSGHIFFADKWYGFDDALYAAVRTLGVLARMDGPLSAAREALPKVVNTPEIRFDCDDTRKFQVIAEVAARLRQDGATVSETDGVRVLTPEGWWLLRASNTQAVLVARAEAKTEAGLDVLKAALVRQLTASGLGAPDFSGDNAGH